jgi:hypothetical protein
MPVRPGWHPIQIPASIGSRCETGSGGTSSYLCRGGCAAQQYRIEEQQFPAILQGETYVPKEVRAFTRRFIVHLKTLGD